VNRDEAQKIVKETFQNPFDKGKFRYFIKNLLNGIDETKAFPILQGQYIYEPFRPRVKQYERIGTYTDPDGKKIDILIVYLHKETTLDHGRTTQRNFIARYLKERGEKDAGLIAFVSPGLQDWRFSLVRMDYKLTQTPKGNLKATEEFTPARRWSFLVGSHENSHTAQSRLAPVMTAVESGLPTLSRLEDVFNIETVTKEFFEKYRELFLRTRETLDAILSQNSPVADDFETKGVSSIDFSKKLLGQIVFLYFLQKKGWFGVGRDADWGTGPRNFLRELFEGKHGAYANFFNDILEPLFYEALARERDDDFYRHFNCRIPFLNGGLFDPIGGYDWVHKDILLPNNLFSNDDRTKEGDIGDGILDIFDRYNFTVKEDEPLEKEVAVDPEMLGKVFENLLEVKDRKSKGTYYTPREIVHYMCRQSLISYLETQLGGTTIAYENLGDEQLDMFGNKTKSGQMDLAIERKTGPSIPKKDIEMLIHFGEQVGENEAIVEAKGRETDTYSYKLAETIRQNAGLIDKKLADIKICDPAVGSGAFLVGMMNEIVKTRGVLSIFIKDPGRTPYAFKRECIEKSLYGVDVDSGAVEIAKLRLWLSLVVDEEDIREIKPLPNLDYKVVNGDSLGSMTWDVWENTLIRELERLKTDYFDETSPGRKKDEKARIDSLIGQLTGNAGHFKYQTHFSEVFGDRYGFDIVIANPPYVRQEGIKKLKPALLNAFRDFYCGTADLYTYFYKRGIELLRPDGHLCFIAPNKFMRAGYGKNTRELLTKDVTPRVVIDFCDLPIFDATTYPSIMLLKKRRPDARDTTLAATFADAGQLESIEQTLDTVGFPMPLGSLRKEGWTLEHPEVLKLMDKLRAAGKPLGEYVNGRFYYGIKTGLNEAFVVNETTRQRLIAEDPKSEELIKPWLRGRDIKKWKAQWARLYLIAIPSSANRKWPWSNSKTEEHARSVFKRVYPAVHNHLSQWEIKLRRRDDQGWFWWELRSCVYYEEFEKPKITYAEISTEGRFALDTTGFYSDTTTYILADASEYLLAILNSKLFTFIFSKTSSEIRGGFLRWKRQYMHALPIVLAPDTQKAPIARLVRQILTDRDNRLVPDIQAEVDQRVYQLYGLNRAEIAIIENASEL